MKYKLYIILLLAIALHFVVQPKACAQKKEATDLNSYIEEPKKDKKAKTKKGGIYFATTTNYTSIDNRDAILLGFKLGKTYPNSLVLGVCTYYYLNGTREVPSLGNRNTFEFNSEGIYGGIFGEYTILRKNKFAITTPLSLGIGNLAYVSNFYDYSNSEWILTTIGSDRFFYIEPGVEAEYFIANYIKIALGMYYRLTTDVSIKGNDIYNNPVELLAPRSASSLSFGISIKVGIFRNYTF